MKKIIVLNYHMSCGGTEKALIAFLKALDYTQYEVVLYQMYLEGSLMADIPKQVTVKEIEFKSKKAKFLVSAHAYDTSIKAKLWKLVRKTEKIIKGEDETMNRLYKKVVDKFVISEDECDILCDFCGYGYFQSVFGAEKIKAQKRIMWLHDERCLWLNKVKSWMYKYDKFYCVSNSVKESFIGKYPEYAEKAEVLLNFIDVDEIKEKSTEASDADENMVGNNILLTVGRIAEQKGYDIAVEAAEILRNKGIEYKWFFVGDGARTEDMRRLIEEKKLEDRVIMLGLKTNPYPYMKKCDLYVQPSRYEGYPIVLIEARVLGCAIVASDIPSVREQIVDGENGYLCNLDAASFANKIADVIENKGLRKAVKDNLKVETISYKKEIDKFYNFIEN